MLGRGFPRLVGTSSCFFSGGKEVEGPARTPSDEGRPREAEVSLSWGRQGPTLLRVELEGMRWRSKQRTGKFWS